MALNIANSYFYGYFGGIGSCISVNLYMKPLQVIEIYIAHNITHALLDPRDRKDVVCWDLVRFYIALLGVKSAGLLQRREISPSSSFRRAISEALGVNILPGSSCIFSALCRPCAQVPRCPGT